MKGVHVGTPELKGSGDHVFQVAYRFVDWIPSQLMVSATTKNNVRGIHWYTAGQTKLVTCVSGAIWDVAVDLRPESDTFCRWEATQLDDVTRRVVVLEPGIGHGFCVLSDKATIVYAVEPVYDPATESSVHPLTLAIPWPTETPWLSARDQAAPSFAELFLSVTS